MARYRHSHGPRLRIVVENGITLPELIERVEVARGRPMRIAELPELAREEGSLCGLWLVRDDEDVILHAPSESALHRQQFLLHELAHMILGHDQSDVVFTPTGFLAETEAVGRVRALARDSLDSAYEIDAETLADDLAAAIRSRGESRFLEVFG